MDSCVCVALSFIAETPILALTGALNFNNIHKGLLDAALDLLDNQARADWLRLHTGDWTCRASYPESANPQQFDIEFYFKTAQLAREFQALDSDLA